MSGIWRVLLWLVGASAVGGDSLTTLTAQWVPDVGSIASASSNPPSVRWTQAGAGWGRPVVSGDTVYFLDKAHHVVALDLSTGQERWRRDTGGDGATTFGATLVSDGAMVFAGDGAVVAFDRETGRERWRFAPPTDSSVGPYLGQAAEGRLFAGSSLGQMYAIDALSGDVQWIAHPFDSQRQITIYAPITAGDFAVAGFTDFGIERTGGVVAIDTRSGVVRWVFRFPEAQSWGGGLVVSGDTVVASSASGALFAVARTAGTLRWQSRGDDAGVVFPEPDYRSLVVSGELAVAGSLAGHVIGYEFETGRVRWRASGPQHGSVAMAMSADGREVFVPFVSGRLLALDADTGRERWSTSQSMGRFRWPVAIGAAQIFAAGESAFVAVDR